MEPNDAAHTSAHLQPIARTEEEANVDYINKFGNVSSKDGTDVLV